MLFGLLVYVSQCYLIQLFKFDAAKIYYFLIRTGFYETKFIILILFKQKVRKHSKKSSQE